MLSKRENENKKEIFLQRNKKTNNQPVILSEEKRRAFFVVEVLPSEERGKTEERSDEGISERIWVAFELM